MTAFFNPTGSVPFSALPQLPSGAVVGNNTGSTGTASAIVGFNASTTLTATGTISYTGIRTSIIANSATPITLTLATSPNIGSIIDIQNIGAGAVTLDPPAGGTINGQSSWTIPAAGSGGIESNITLRCESSTAFSII